MVHDEIGITSVIVINAFDTVINGLRMLHFNLGYTYEIIANIFGVSKSVIARICRYGSNSGVGIDTKIKISERLQYMDIIKNALPNSSIFITRKDIINTLNIISTWVGKQIEIYDRATKDIARDLCTTTTVINTIYSTKNVYKLRRKLSTSKIMALADRLLYLA